MRIGGKSFKGSYHKENQDRFLCEAISHDVYLMVVSDGLGSKANSGEGAEALTMAAKAVLIARNGMIVDLKDLEKYISEVHNRWKAYLMIDGLDIKKSYCTCMIFIITGSKLFLLQCGDGFIAVAINDDIVVFSDDKENGFVNETLCLSETFNLADWNITCMDMDSFQGAVACTDGVSVADEKIEIFLQDFIREMQDKSQQEIVMNISMWLNNWKTSDDKTLAFVLPSIKVEG